MAHYNHIDENGWRVPRKGSRSMRIYELSRTGHTPAPITALIGGSAGAIRVLLWKIRNPYNANEAQREWYDDRHR